jgi:hypothetical protein
MRLLPLVALALLVLSPHPGCAQIRISRDGQARRLSPGVRFDGSVASPPAEQMITGQSPGGIGTALLPTEVPLPGAPWALLDANHPTEPQHGRILGVGLRYAGYPDGGYFFAAAEPPLGSVLIVYITSPASGSFFLVQCEVDPGAYTVSRHPDGPAGAVQMNAPVASDHKLVFMLDNAAQGGHGFNISRDDHDPWQFRGCEVRKLS